jgi:hypothetical protein
LLEIWDEGRKISFWDYIKRFENLNARPAKRGEYLELRKDVALDLNLELVSMIDLNDLCSQWWGKKSVYRIRRSA